MSFCAVDVQQSETPSGSDLDKTRKAPRGDPASKTFTARALWTKYLDAPMVGAWKVLSYLNVWTPGPSGSLEGVMR